ncbi:MAG: glycosyltransferase [Saprospiraceae bacterium]|nr:glycosyltransferase [Saprospiraceae bacterium]
MKIVIISSRFPYPLDKGDKLRLYHQIRILSAHHQIVLISLTESKISSEEQAALEAYCHKIYTFYISKTGILWNIVKGVLRGLPAQVSYFYQNSIDRQISKIVGEEKPDHLYCQLIRTSEYGKHFTMSKTLDYMDCFHISTFKRAQHIRGWRQLLWNLESRAVRRYEASIYRYFNNHTIISPVDRQSMGLGVSKPMTLVPNGLNESYYFEIQPTPIRNIDVLFLGNLSYFSNIAAVLFLVREILPKLDKNKSRKIAIAGAQPPDWMKKLIARYPQMELMENPVDTRQIYQRAKLFVAPIFAGTGQQNKILEAIASNCIVLCTPDVQAALGIRTPELIHVQQTAEGFAWEIDQILTNPEAFISQSRQAQDYIRKYFSWEKNTQILEKLIAGTIPEKNTHLNT